MFKSHGEACAYFRINKAKMSESELLVFMQRCRDMKDILSPQSRERIFWLDLIDEVELALAMKSSEIQLDLSSEYRDIIKPSDSILLTVTDYKSTNLLSEVSRDLTRQLLDYFDHNQKRTAMALGVPLRTLGSHLQRYEMEGKLVRHYALRKLS